MLLIALLLKGFSGCTSQYKLSVSTLYYLYLNVYKTKEREKRAVEITLHGIIAHHCWAAVQDDWI